MKLKRSPVVQDEVVDDHGRIPANREFRAVAKQEFAGRWSVPGIQLQQAQSREQAGIPVTSESASVSGT